ncbi:MAG: hypothetical protein AB7P23_01490 [Amphiplicatus sp.]
MGSTSPDTETPQESPRPFENGAAPAGEPAARRARLRGGGRALGRLGVASARFLDFLAVDETRRRRASISLAVAFNFMLFTILAVFGRFEIWIPATPGDSLRVVMVELPPVPELPALRDPKVVPEPEPEPEPEIVEKPELKPEPIPEPIPAPEPERAPESEPEPAPPPIDLTPDPVFAPPSEKEDAPFIPEPQAPAPPPDEPFVITEPPPQAEERPSQTAAEETPPLVEPEPANEAEPARAEEKEEDAELPDALAEAPAAAEAPTGDDAFDEEPVFGSRRPLPAVNLPEGQAAADPGASGVVAIFCPEYFTDKDKAAECAGRTEIRSGWRPGSGEDWSEAIRLLKQERAHGAGGTDPGMIYGQEAGRALQDAQKLRDLKDFRRSMDDLNDPAGAAGGNLTNTLGQPNIGPAEFNPSWTLKDDPDVSRKDLRKLEKALEDAEKETSAPPR